MLHVNLFNTLYVTFITEAITTYEANVEQSETDFGITEQHNVILKAYNLCKHFRKSVDHTVSTAQKSCKQD